MNPAKSKEMLKDFKKIQTLWTWLYADGAHEISVENSVGARLSLRMDADGSVLARNALNGNWFCYDGMLSVPIWLGVIEQLESAPPENHGKSRWDEIVLEAGLIGALNRG